MIEETVSGIISHPLTWFLVAACLAVVLVLSSLSQNARKSITPYFDYPMVKLGICLTAAVWLVLVIFTFASIVQLFLDRPAAQGAKADAWVSRLHYLAYVGLVAALGGLVALPLNLIRIRQTNRANENAENVLFNEKVNAASLGLAARKRVSKSIGHGDKIKLFDEWQDDLVARNGAIERLNTLARERPGEAQAIVDQISVYVRELTSEVPLRPLPKPANQKELRNWGWQLKADRTDLEVAKRAIGAITEQVGGTYASLQWSNFQGHDFSRLAKLRAIFDHASLNGAQLQNVDLSGSSLRYTNAQIVYLSGANLTACDCCEASFNSSDLSDTNFSDANISEAKMVSVDMQNAVFKGAKARQTQMQGSAALAADFSFADLRYATLPDYETTNGNFRFDFKPLTGAALSNQEFTKIENPDLFFPAFGDASVKLPNGLRAGEGVLAHWANKILDESEFNHRWRAYQKSIGYILPTT